jgi:centromeric protein E
MSPMQHPQCFFLAAYSPDSHRRVALQVRSVKHALDMVASGDSQRKVSATQFNEDSSRSHTLCQVSIESCNAKSRDDRIISQFNLIDLAGSESARATSDQTRRKEGSYINKSLLTLGAVISKLSEGSSVHIPFRDSKLTRLLQSSLSGCGAKVAVVCCITSSSAQVCPVASLPYSFFLSGCDCGRCRATPCTVARRHDCACPGAKSLPCVQAEETHNTLKFATRAKAVKIAAVRNKIADNRSQIMLYQQQIHDLRRQLVLVQKRQTCVTAEEYDSIQACPSAQPTCALLSSSIL